MGSCLAASIRYLESPPDREESMQRAEAIAESPTYPQKLGLKIAPAPFAKLL